MAIVSIAIGIAQVTLPSSASPTLCCSAPSQASLRPIVSSSVGLYTRTAGRSTPCRIRITQDLRDRNTVFEGLAAYRPMAEAFGLTVDGSAQQAYGTEVSANYFDVTPACRSLSARAFEATDDRLERPRAVIVIAHRLWEGRFNRERDVIGLRGAAQRAASHLCDSLGVAAPGFTGTNLSISDFWIPIAAYTTLRAASIDANDVSRNPSTVLTARAPVWMVANGRLKPGVTLAQAREEVARIARDLSANTPDANRGRSIGVEPSRPIPTPGRTPRRCSSHRSSRSSR